MLAPPFPAAAIAAARDAAKTHLRIDGDGEDAVIDRFAGSALALCEAFTGEALIVREFDAVLDAARQWQALPVACVRSISAVAGLHADGAAFAISPDTYAVDIDAQGNGWVRMTAPLSGGRVMVTFTAGQAAEWDAVPASLAQGVTLLIAHLFAGRDGDAAPPAAVCALWRPWRRLRLRGAERAA